MRGGTGWGAEFAKLCNKPLYVFDQDKDAWLTWTGEAWTPTAIGEPVITHPHFTGTGTRTLRENGARAIEALFKRSFSVESGGVGRRHESPDDQAIVDVQTPRGEYRSDQQCPQPERRVPQQRAWLEVVLDDLVCGRIEANRQHADTLGVFGMLLEHHALEFVVRPVVVIAGVFVANLSDNALRAEALLKVGLVHASHGIGWCS